MFKLLILLNTTAFTSAPINQLYQQAKISEQKSHKDFRKEIDLKINKQEETNPLGSSGDPEGRWGTVEEISKFDYLVPNWEWFTKLRTHRAIGYTDLDDHSFEKYSSGLCEYISMAFLLQYQELFVSSGFFTDSEWEKWFEDSRDGERSPTEIIVPSHKYYSGGNLGTRDGLVKELYRTYNKTDLWSSTDVANSFNKFLTGKEMKQNVRQAKSASWWHTSHPSDYVKKERVPVMFSFASVGHNITIYGYNSKTDELAVHYGWGADEAWDSTYSSRIVKQSSLWSLWSMGFWNTIYVPKNASQNSPRKAFKYNGTYYSWKELNNMGKNWNDVAAI